MLFFVIMGSAVPLPRQRHRVAVSRTGRTYAQNYSPRHGTGRTWQEVVRFAAISAMAGRPPLVGELVLSLEFVLPDRRWRDLSNLTKAVEDACNGVLWHDDNQIVEQHITKRVAGEGEKPFVVVKVKEVEG